MSKAPSEAKHISQLSAAKRARALQEVQNALLAIVANQSGAVTLPLDVLAAVSETHRLKVEIDDKAGVLILTAEKAPTQIIQ
jgi:ribosomal 50S subunit-associated protein YjgA (DUF615 family)